MPKIKTHKATAKRFHYTGSGKLMRPRVGKSHLRRRKPRRTLAMLDDTFVVTELATFRRIQKLAPTLDKKPK